MKAGMKAKQMLPGKPVWTVFWFVLVGAIALIVNLFYLNSEGFTLSTASQAASGPLPGSGAPTAVGDFVPAETDEQILARLDSIQSPHQPIEDPGGRALSSFVRDIHDLARRKRSQPVRIIHYGDSILTTDQLSGQARFILQRKFGDGGHGFVLLGQPWRWYRHLGVEHGARGKWRVRPFTSDPLQDGLYGLGGVAFQAERGSKGSVWAGSALEGDMGRQVSRFDISYLEQPGGGSFQVHINDLVSETVSTDGSTKRTVHREFKVPMGAARMNLQYRNDGPVRLFGAALETGEPGVVWDSLAINGARASALARFDREHWISELKQRDPSLIILMMGANEGANRFLVLPEYQKHLASVIEVLKDGLPGTSCLVVGALDQAKRNPDGTFASKRMPKKLSEAQRAVALANGCGFFDTWTAMGGDGSMGQWFRRGLGGGDLIHPTEHGARKIGNWLAEALLFATRESSTKNQKKN